VRHGIAMEHLLSHVAAELLGHPDGFDAPNDTRGSAPAATARGVVLACVPGELHELPLIVLHAALNATGITATRLDAPTCDETLDEAVARHRRPVIALHAITPEPADPTLFDRFPTGTAQLALGPGWHPPAVPTGVAHVNSLAAALDAITSLVGAHRGIPRGDAAAAAQ